MVARALADEHAVPVGSCSSLSSMRVRGRYRFGPFILEAGAASDSLDIIQSVGRHMLMKRGFGGPHLWPECQEDVNEV